MTSYRLDRIFWSKPPWSTRFLDISGGTLGFPDQMHRDGLSDHSPVTLSARSVDRHRVEDRPIPSWVTYSPQFRIELQKRIKGHYWLSKIDLATECSFAAFDFDRENFSDFDSFSLHNHLKTVIKQAAEVARNDILQAVDAHISLEGEPSEPTCALLTSMSRAYWYNELKLAGILLAYHKSAKQFLALRAG